MYNASAIHRLLIVEFVRTHHAIARFLLSVFFSSGIVNSWCSWHKAESLPTNNGLCQDLPTPFPRADFVLNQFFTESFAIGVNGYFYKQIGADSGSGAVLGSFKGEGAGIGPAIYYSKKIGSRDVYFIAKWVHDYHAENRVKADYAYTSFALSF